MGSVAKVGSGALSPSSILFFGREDLGGGNSAFFQLENGSLVGTGGSKRVNFFGRQSLAGVGRSFDTVSLGRCTRPTSSRARWRKAPSW